MMTLFEKFDDNINDELIEKLKTLSGNSIGDTKASLTSIFYTLLAGLIRRANSEMSMNMLISQIKRINEKDLKNVNLKDKFKSTNELTKFIEVGEKTFSQLFPSFRSPLLSLVIKHCGTSKKETTLNTGFVNSLLIKLLGEEIQNGVNQDTMANYLKEHKDPLFEMASDDFLDKMIPALGMEEMRDLRQVISRRKEEVVKALDEEVTSVEENDQDVGEEEEYEEESASRKPLLIGVILVLIAVLGYFIYDSREELFNSDESSESSSVIIPIDSTQLLDSLSMMLEKEIMENQIWLDIQKNISNQSFDPQNQISINTLFFQGDSVVLSNLNNPIIDSLAQEFGRNSRFQIQIRGGHSAGDQQIAVRRAFYLKRSLQNKGVDPIKIDAVADRENLDYLKIRIISK